MTNSSQNANQHDLFSGQIIGQILNLWGTENRQIARFYEKYPDDLLRQPIIRGRNSPYYLLGHLTATSDALMPHLRLGELLYPDLEQFLKLPEQQVVIDLPVATLVNYLKEINDRVLEAVSKLTTIEWLERHGLVSPEDFRREPGRNRLNVFMSRIGHQRYHAGQLALFIPGNAFGNNG